MFDWDAGSRNDLLGFADVPLRGVLQNGYISAALGLPSTEKGGKKGEKKKTMAAGSGGKDSAVAGKIELLGTPRYAQFGDVVHRIPGMTYLALHVISAKGLLSRSEDGHEPAAGRHSTRHSTHHSTRHSPRSSSRYRYRRSEDGHDANPFVTATWDQVSQQTRVVRRSTAPQFGETIYFPLRLLTLHGEEGKKALEKKGGAAATAPTHPPHTSNAPHCSTRRLATASAHQSGAARAASGEPRVGLVRLDYAQAAPWRHCSYRVRFR
mgnify:CR=1 FL=1